MCRSYLRTCTICAREYSLRTRHTHSEGLPVSLLSNQSPCPIPPRSRRLHWLSDLRFVAHHIQASSSELRSYRRLSMEPLRIRVRTRRFEQAFLGRRTNLTATQSS